MNRTHLAILALVLGASAAIELGWWWAQTKMRVRASIPWRIRRRLYMRPH